MCLEYSNILVFNIDMGSHIAEVATVTPFHGPLLARLISHPCVTEETVTPLSNPHLDPQDPQA